MGMSNGILILPVHARRRIKYSRSGSRNNISLWPEGKGITLWRLKFITIIFFFLLPTIFL
jgi:hypothetical protein